jgi:hypothetical protein
MVLQQTGRQLIRILPMLFARVDPANDAPIPPLAGGASAAVGLPPQRGRRADQPRLVGEFIEACGEEALDVLSALDFFVAAMRQTRQPARISRSARRPCADG